MRFQVALLSVTLVLAMPNIALADVDTDVTPTQQTSSANDIEAQISKNKSYAIPALEIIGFDILLNEINRRTLGSDYDTNLSTIKRNFHRHWVIDNDPFNTNQFLHPYQGSIYHGFARSAGLNYWESLGYTFAGSAFWEIAGETTAPSKNDQIASGIAGTFLGEPLFRMANLLLEDVRGVSSFWRELGAVAISPSTGFNRLVFGDRFDAIFPSHKPAYLGRYQFGFSGTAQNNPGASMKLKRDEAVLDAAMDYGLPGKPGYPYTRPFDYFSFQASISSANNIENILSRGLLIGTDYEVGKNYRGVWGLYGSYDYIKPQVFRISSTALSLGTTAQWWLSDAIALQGTALAGLGYAAVGTINGINENDYHYGATPQALLTLRFIFGDKALLDLTARDYYVSRVASASTGGHDNIARIEASFTARIHGPHAITIKHLWNRRDASYPTLGDQTQTRGTIGIFYTFVTDKNLGSVEWR